MTDNDLERAIRITWARLMAMANATETREQAFVAEYIRPLYSRTMAHYQRLIDEQSARAKTKMLYDSARGGGKSYEQMNRYMRGLKA